MSLEKITAISNLYGRDSHFVLAGGGNTSYKTDSVLYVKPSGVTLADIEESNFVKLDREAVREVFAVDDNLPAVVREATVKKIMANAVCFDSNGRPSVEAPLHEIIPTKYVVHLHPAAVNGMSCGINGPELCKTLFPDALWIDYIDPGFILAKTVANKIAEYKNSNGSEPRVIFLQNHGVFVGGDNVDEIDAVYSAIMAKLDAHYTASGCEDELIIGELDRTCALANAPVLRSLLGDESPVTITVQAPFAVADGPLTPDHVVYAKSFALITDEISPKVIEEFVATHGYKPKVVAVPGKAVFCAGATIKDATTVAQLAHDAALVQQLTAACGGFNYMSDASREFIENWEVESYRQSIASTAGAKVLSGKIAIVTGGAQGFGFGIAEVLADAGATIVIADMNLDGATAAAEQLNEQFGAYSALALRVNIADEASVCNMIEELTLKCGGLDLFVANAGVLRAGSVKLLEKRDWDFVTDINYTGYFLCVKYASRVMSLQNKFGKSWSDIVQINSKSGLQGSNKNGAYAGSKFGTIGLTQSFAMELIEDKIKVNSICPGNFFDGPLWSNPDNGLFVQYLNSGKVPGAKTIEDVKHFYEAKVPMGRGCNPVDVAKAIIYAVGQQYETGQAIPVTGGQVMMN
jgi:NAD(P)-dependent dehydrogenase (short-subunit alcohol dehydrogenase family)/rhamnose utilization protein RhaD (predicted bifunctional aldolase and dehydrogenase)